jgi:hypothetical protein
VSIEVGGLVTGELDGEAALGLVVGTVPATPLGFSVGEIASALPDAHGNALS